MKSPTKTLFGFVLVALLLSVQIQHQASYAADNSDRVDSIIDQDWHFHRGDVAGAQNTGYTNDQFWSRIKLPHTWNNVDGQDGSKYYRGRGWYRTQMMVPANSEKHYFCSLMVQI